MVWIDDRWGMNTKEAIKAFKKMSECAHAYGYSSLPYRQPTEIAETNDLHKVEPLHIAEALDRYSSSHEVPTTDVLEKIQKEIEDWLKDPGINCQVNWEDIDKQTWQIRRIGEWVNEFTK